MNRKLVFQKDAEVAISGEGFGGLLRGGNTSRADFFLPNRDSLRPRGEGKDGERRWGPTRLYIEYQGEVAV